MNYAGKFASLRRKGIKRGSLLPRQLTMPSEGHCQYGGQCAWGRRRGGENYIRCVLGEASSERRPPKFSMLYREVKRESENACANQAPANQKTGCAMCQAENRKVRIRKQRRRESKTQGRESESRQARTGKQPERGEGCHSHVELQGRSRHQLLLQMKCHNCPRFSVSSTIFTFLHLAWKNNSNRGVGWGAAPQLQTIKECGSSCFRSFWGQISRRCRCGGQSHRPMLKNIGGVAGGPRPPHLQTSEECITWHECHICRRVFVLRSAAFSHLAWNLQKQPRGRGLGSNVGRTSVQGCRCQGFSVYRYLGLMVF